MQGMLAQYAVQDGAPRCVPYLAYRCKGNRLLCSLAKCMVKALSMIMLSLGWLSEHHASY